MAVFTKGTWAWGCVHTVVNDDPVAPNVVAVAKWLHKLPFNEFCDALQSMIDDGYMDKDRADKTYNAYAKKHETHNAYEET